MPLDDTFPATVGFVVGWRKGLDGQLRRSPIGTGFIVSVPAEPTNTFFVYFVTAAHVVRAESETWVRCNTKDGATADLVVPEWFFHPSDDIAISPCDFPDQISWKLIQSEQFADELLAENPEAHLELGDSVFFVGLLANMTAMAEANIPMVRSGTLGRMFQSDIPLTLGDGSIIHINGHLIDCRSYSGFSGSPCFAQVDFWRGPEHWVITPLIGLISGHFDDWAKAEVTGDFIGDVRFPANTGVGIVTPMQAIREALDMEELVRMRKAANKHAREYEDKASLGTADRREGDSTQQFTRSNFADALEKVTRKLDPPNDDEGANSG